TNTNVMLRSIGGLRPPFLAGKNAAAERRLWRAYARPSRRMGARTKRVSTLRDARFAPSSGRRRSVCEAVDGGRGWDRTSDPYDVNVASNWRNSLSSPPNSLCPCPTARAVPTSPQLLHRACAMVGANGRVTLHHAQRLPTALLPHGLKVDAAHHAPACPMM